MWSALLAAVMLVTSAPVTVVTGATETHTDPPAWGACPPAPAGVVRDPRQQCARLEVPLDYRKPHGRTIGIEISRIATARPGTRRGVLLFNPGGPGHWGLDMPDALLPAIPAAVTDAYDLIGFDPRGVEYSTPLTCGIPDDTPIDLRAPYPAPDGSIDRNVAYARRTAQSCARLSGDLLPYITTANTARDLDRIRAALGEPKLSYLGYSYGTYLGAVYTTLFPQRSDRIVLDSAVDPRRVWYDFLRTWDQAVALRLPDFTAWAAARDATYHLGATATAVEDTYYALIAKFDRTPLTLPSGLVVNGNLIRELTRQGLYDDVQFPSIAANWQQLAAVPDAPGANGVNAKAFAALGTWAVPSDNETAAQDAVLCGDAAWPAALTTYSRNVRTARNLFPATGGMPDNLWPCAFWPNKPVEPPVTVTDRGPRNVLILQNRRDPATAWTSGLGLRQVLGRRAAFVGVDQGGHGVYLVSQAPCAAAIATAFLTTGTLPAHDQLCPGQSPGTVSPRAARPQVRLP
jgi:pimeloyl-ACP methyl ester carboxylesterase